jgi:hypothetical protein
MLFAQWSSALSATNNDNGSTERTGFVGYTTIVYSPHRALSAIIPLLESLYKIGLFSSKIASRVMDDCCSVCTAIGSWSLYSQQQLPIGATHAVPALQTVTLHTCTSSSLSLSSHYCVEMSCLSCLSDTPFSPHASSIHTLSTPPPTHAPALQGGQTGFGFFEPGTIFFAVRQCGQKTSPH